MSGLLSLLACAPQDAPPPRAPVDQPDIIVIALDTVRWDRTSLADTGPDTTPTLARLARLPGSVRFTRAYTAASWSLAAYASLFTGRDALSHGLGFSRKVLAEEHRTLAEVLSAYGYQTAAFSSGPHLDQVNGLARGFSTYRHAQDFAPLTPQIGPALDWLASARQQDAPYLLFVQGYDAHPPYTAPSVFSERFTDSDGGRLHDRALRSPECRVIATRECVSSLDSVRRHLGAEADLSAEHAHISGHYDAAVRAGDYNLGRLLSGIEQAGALNEAIIVVLSDHGKSLSAQGYPDPTSAAEQLFHVPLIIHLPTTAPAASWDGVVSLTDVLPTLLDHLGMVSPASVTGQSLLAPLLDPTLPTDPDRATLSAELCCYAVQTRDWELRGDRRMLPTQDGATWDAASDEAPVWAETRWQLFAAGSPTDVAVDHPDVVAALRGQLAHWPAELAVDADTINGAAGDQEELRDALRRGGYWAPDEAAP
ncbi:MAG: arylsulfatase A-like enzyme [Myxococcota bacterium]|jgi:arylsulfatase A-like enzyme